MIKRNFVLSALLCASVSLYALSVRAEEIYKYDANGNLIEETNSYGSYKTLYTYDSNNNRTSRVHYWCMSNPCTAQIKYEYVYDANGNQLYWLDYHNPTAIENNSPGGKYGYTYDTNGNQTSYVIYPCSGGTCSNTPSSKYEYTYDSNGNQTSELYSSCSGNTCTASYKVGYTYDSNGNQTSSTRYSCSYGTCSTTPNSKYEYTYDEHGNPIGVKYYSGSNFDTPSMQETWENTYDEYGNMLEGKILACCGRLTDSVNYSYEYDDYGNIVKKYSNGSLSETHIYDIGYIEKQCNPLGTCSDCSDTKLFRDGYCIPQEQGCGERFKQLGKECKHLSYTPPEAEELTSENNNMLLIRYK